MKKLSLLFCGLIGLLSSCDKQDGTGCGPVMITAPSSELISLQTYISSNGISAMADERGFFYTIGRLGTDVRPSVCSNVRVSYTGRLTNGAQFDAQNGATLNLKNVIPGWQEGVPLIGEGGSIVLYLPPSLGYGSNAVTGIPPNSIIVFQIDLIDVI